MLFKRTASILAGITAALVVSACAGNTETASNITSTSANLNAKVMCEATTTNNPCEVQFKYWEDGSTAAPQLTAPIVANVKTPDGGFAISQSVSGLKANTLYRYQVCGKGDSITTTTCIGTLSDSVTTSSKTAKPTSLDEVRSFRTAPDTAATSRGSADERRLTAAVERSQSVTLNRDVGMSVQYQSNPAKSLWVFGDTGMYNTQNELVGLVMGSTAATGTSFAPGSGSVSLTELNANRGGNNGIYEFLTRAPAISGCEANKSVRWITGLTLRPGTTRAVATFGDYCLSQPSWPRSRSGLAEYNAATNTFTRTEVLPFVNANGAALDHRLTLNSPVFATDSYLYFYAARSLSMEQTGAVWLMRVPTDSSKWAAPANYEWWNGSTFATTVGSAAPVFSGNVGGIEVKDFGSLRGTAQRYVMQVQDWLTPAFRVYTAPNPQGPWTLRTNGPVPDKCEGGLVGCYALSPHPELSTSSKLVYTYYAPQDGQGKGHLRSASIAW